MGRQPGTRPTQHLTFVVEGIGCGACCRAIEQAVDTLPGVIRVRAHYVSGRVDVEVLPGEADEAAVCRAVEALGPYRCLPFVAEAR